MTDYWLTITLHSDATFGRGEGLAGLVDTEIEHDSAGCPFVNGRTIKGWLVEAWLEIRTGLHAAAAAPWDAAASRLFGQHGEQPATLHIGAATLPPILRAALHADVEQQRLPAADVLALFTSIRRQTAVDTTRDTPQDGSLRSLRVLRRDTLLLAPLHFDTPPADDDLPVLAACVLGVRRGGLGRNRGRGQMLLRLHKEQPAATPAAYANEDYTRSLFAHVIQKVQPA